MRNRLSGVGAELGRRGRRTFRQGAPDHVILHCGHHKVGTVWWGNVLGAMASHYGRRYIEVPPRASTPEADVYLFPDTRDFRRATFDGRPFRGTHLVRDPRDIVVSGYFYHLWTDEPWANTEDERYGGRTYREHLNGLDREDGLLLELERTCRGGQLPEMLRWDYGQDEFLELHYEDLIADEQGSFERVFRHYGFDDAGVEHGLSVVDAFSFRRVSGREVGEVGQTSHLRSGRPGEWREHFTPRIEARWRELAPDALVRLGYDTSVA